MNTRKAINLVRKLVFEFLSDPNYSNENRHKLAKFLVEIQIQNHFYPKRSKVLWKACQLGLDHIGYGYYGTKCPN
jgi:hypothetical protein